MPDANRTALDANSDKPKQAAVDGVTIAQHPLLDQIAADRYLSANVAAAKNHFGLRFGRIIPPDATGQHPGS